MLIFSFLALFINVEHGFETSFDSVCPVFISDIQLLEFDTAEAKVSLLIKLMIFD